MLLHGKTVLLLLAVAAVLSGNTLASLQDIPSSHHSGSTYYDTTNAEGRLAGRIDFAVYDTVTNPTEGVEFFSFNPNNDQFIYVYQIFNDYTNISELAVGYFGLVGVNIAVIGSVNAGDDSAGGIEPSHSDPSGYWDFKSPVLFAGEHSWFLILTSENDWVKGSYEIKPADDDFPVPGCDIPEPATILLFSVSAVMLCIARKSDSAIR